MVGLVEETCVGIDFEVRLDFPYITITSMDAPQIA